MSTYTHILVGLDLSDECKNILAKAKKIADSHGAKLSVAHVFEPLAFAYGGDVPVDLSEAQGVMEKQITKRLKEISAPFDIAETSQLVRVGQTSSELHSAATELGADLIIVGSHARHGLAALFGNTANGVIRGAECDVLAVRI